MRSLASPRTQADEELGSPTYQQYGAWGAAAAGPYDSVGSLESSPRWSQGDDLGSQASSPREELPSYRSADDATPEVSLGTPSRPACTCTIGSHSAGCSEADSISGCHNGGNGGSSAQWVSSPTWSHRESPRGDSADDQKRTTGMDERLRRGLVVSVAPNGPHGTLRDLIFYLCNNHVLLSAIGFAHEGHPYSAQRRRLVLLNSVGFAFFLACLVAIGTTSCAREPGRWHLHSIDWRALLSGDSTERHPCGHGHGSHEDVLASTLPLALSPVLELLRDWPTTLCVLIQLLWDVPGGSLGICPCAQRGPCRRPCGRGMLVCFVCHLLGMVYAAAGAVLLFLFTGLHFVTSLHDAASLLITTKALAFALALPTSACIFALLRRAEIAQIEISRRQVDSVDGSWSASVARPPLVSPRIGNDLL